MRWEMILMSKMENNTVNKAGSTGVELNLNDGTQRYQVTKKDLKKTADRYNFMACTFSITNPRWVRL